MEIQRKKCSANKHSDTNAVSYCQACDKYLCSKCQNFHYSILLSWFLAEVKAT